MTDKPVDKWAQATETDLPSMVQSLIAYRGADTVKAQTLMAGDLRARWDLLADAAKGPLVWKAIAGQMGPQALRMNLNTLLRHGVFHVVPSLREGESVRLGEANLRGKPRSLF